MGYQSVKKNIKDKSFVSHFEIIQKNTLLLLPTNKKEKKRKNKHELKLTQQKKHRNKKRGILLSKKINA